MVANAHFSPGNPPPTHIHTTEREKKKARAWGTHLGSHGDIGPEVAGSHDDRGSGDTTCATEMAHARGGGKSCGGEHRIRALLYADPTIAFVGFFSCLGTFFCPYLALFLFF